MMSSRHLFFSMRRTREGLLNSLRVVGHAYLNLSRRQLLTQASTDQLTCQVLDSFCSGEAYPKVRAKSKIARSADAHDAARTKSELRVLLLTPINRNTRKTSAAC